MKYQTVIPVPGNYEGIYDERVNRSRESREIVNSFTQPIVSSIPNKTYKPFTNTLKIPPIEHPIILNPNYRDKFAKYDLNRDASELSRKELAVKIIVERLKYVQSLSKDRTNNLYQNNYRHKNETERHKLQNVEMHDERKNKVLKLEGIGEKGDKKDLQTIHMTALNIIDENIKKAVSVAEQIKQEIDVELTGKRQERRELRETNESNNKISHRKQCIQNSSKQHAFSLGVQTIPYMRTYMQSKNFNSMLIKRIFLQFTNFMVSLTKYLSRHSNISHNCRKSIDHNTLNSEHFEAEYNEEIILSGAEMSRKFGKTPLEFTKRMDTVITEFEKRTGIEHTTLRRSRSRSRSSPKDKYNNIVNDDFVDKTDVDEGKNIYRAFVTEEWSEYYGLKQPEISKMLKSEKFMESETIKKETIEKIVEEKIQKEFPITYVAIVQAHVFTNHDAIIRDTQEDKHEKHTIIHSLKSKKESLIEAEEQSAIYTDLEHQLIRINKQKPIEKEVVVESIEDITPVEEYKTFPAIEQVKTGIAVQKTTEVLDPVMEIHLDKQDIVNARQAMEPSSISIAGIQPVVLEEEKDNSFILPEIKHRKSVTLFEQPLKPIAETTKIDTFEPREEILNIHEKALAQLTPSFEAPLKSVAQVSQVEINEPQSRPLQLEIPIEGRSKELVQTPVQSVAVNMETFTDETKIDLIDTSQTKTEISKILVEPISTTVAKKSEVHIDETTVYFDKNEVDLQHLKETIEPPSQLVAQKFETNLDESYANVSTRQIETESIQETFEQPLKVVAQTLETSTDVANLSIFKRDSLLSENSKIYFEVPSQTVAQVGEIYTETAAGLFETPKNYEEIIKMSVEIPNKSIAEKFETSAEENIHSYLSENKLDFENIRKSMEPMKCVAEKYEIDMNDIGKEFNKFEATRSEPKVAIQTPLRLTAETSVTLSEEAIGIVEKNKSPQETIKPHSVPEFKSVAEVSLTLTDETTGIYKKTEVDATNTFLLIEPPIKPVAEISEPYFQELSESFDKKPLISTEKPNTSVEITFRTLANKSEINFNEDNLRELETLQINNVIPGATINNSFKTVPEITEVTLSDFSENMNMPVFNTGKTKTGFEIPNKIVAEKSEAYADKLEIQIFQSTKINIDKPRSTIETPNKTVAENSMIVADEPKPYNLEIETFEIKSPKLLMEDSLRFLPETGVLIPEGPKLEALDMPHIDMVEGKISIDKLEPTITTQILLAEPSQIPFDDSQLQTKVPRALMEEPLLTLPEVSMPSLAGPKDAILLLSKTSEEHANLNLQSSNAASASEIAILEPQCDTLDIFEIKERQHHSTIEDVKFTVSDIQENVILGPKDDILFTPLIVKTSATLKVDEQKALEESVVISEEILEKYPELRIDVKRPKIYVEEDTKTVAENVQIGKAESEKSFSVSNNTINEKVASMTIQSLACLAQTATIPLEEVSVGEKSIEITKNQAKVYVQELSAANIGQIIALSSVKDENFHTSQDTKNIKSKVESVETLKATVNKVDVKESKVQITEVFDDKCEEVAMNYKVEFTNDDTEKLMTRNNKVLELDAEIIKKDIEYIENASIIQSADESLKSKSYKTSTVAISEVKLNESESSKSPSPTSPVNDVYMFCVATPYSRHEPEPPIAELDYKSIPKRRYTQGEISVAQSIGILYQVSDSEDEVETIEVEYEKHRYESDINMEASITEHNIQSHMEQHSSEYTMEKQQHSEVHKVMQFSNDSAMVDAKGCFENTSKSQASLALRQDRKETIEHQADKLNSKRKSEKSKQQCFQHRETTLQTESRGASLEISGAYQTQVISQSDIQSLEQNRQAIQHDIKVTEKDIESRHALLEYDVASKKLVNKEKVSIKQTENGFNEQVDSQGLKSPPTEPSTPLTDEYIFRLMAPLPPSREGTPVPRDCTSSSSSESEEEIRRKLIPHIDLSIQQRIFDPPLPTPPTSPPVTSVMSPSRNKPLYSKPGLKGGGVTVELTKEDVLEIGRQSNLLASAIDKTIKRIEEYKSQAGIMEYTSSEMSSSESRTVSEYRSEDNKVEVLIDKMVETSRRFSGEGEESGKSKEVIIPIVQDDPKEESHESEVAQTNCASKTVEERKMEQTKLSDQLLHSVQMMVDPSASLEERLAQMQAQIAELSKLPDLIHKTLDEVKVQFEQLNYQVQQKSTEIQPSQIEKSEQVQTIEKVIETPQEQPSIEVTVEDVKQMIEEIPEPDTEIQNIIDKRRLEAESKTRDEIMKERLSQELRIAAERLSPKLGFEDRNKMSEDRPYMGFTHLTQTTPSDASPMGEPSELSLPMGVPSKAIVPQVIPTAGTALETARPGKVWKKSDNYDDANLEQMLSETLAAQAEVIKGKAIGVNFMKYEKPPPGLEHLQNSEVYKTIHEMDQKPLKKVEMLKPAIAASDYVERLRSVSPTPAKTLIEDCEV